MVLYGRFRHIPINLLHLLPGLQLQLMNLVGHIFQLYRQFLSGIFHRLLCVDGQRLDLLLAHLLPVLHRHNGKARGCFHQGEVLGGRLLLQ